MTNPLDLWETCSSRLAWLTRFGDSVVDLLFPPRCVACHGLGAWLCSACLAEVERIRAPLCPRCGLPLEAAPARHDCRSLPPLDGLRACAFYGGPLREAIHQFKYQDLRALAAPLGRLLAESWPALAGSTPPPDIVIPVPLHPSRQRQRGYNQSALLARELATALGRPLAGDALLRVKVTRPQVELDFQQRQSNVRDAFHCPGSLGGQAVLLVDDVCTTGSTLASAAKALKDAGAGAVVAYTLARARGPGPS